MFYYGFCFMHCDHVPCIPKICIHEAFMNIHVVSKFQLSTLNRFFTYKKFESSSVLSKTMEVRARRTKSQLLCNVFFSVETKGAFRLDAKQREATRSNQNLTSSTARERLQPLATFASSCATALACRL